MASKSAQQEPVKAEVIEDALDTVDKTLDRVKVLYEQYFLGIQKQPPQFLHADVERKLRDLAQLQIRNTALRYRFATIQQKFGSYNTYWRRTLRQIETGKYHRNLSKIGRQAAQTGAEIPEEILAAMPKRMREQVRRDREAALALQRRREDAVDDAELLTLVPLEDEAAHIREPAEARRGFPRPGSGGGTHVLDESDADLDLDAYFKSIQSEDDEDGEDGEDSTALVPRRPGAAAAAEAAAAPGTPAAPASGAAPARPPARLSRPPTQAGVQPAPASPPRVASAALPPVPRQTPPAGLPALSSPAPPAGSRTTTNRRSSTQVASPVPPPASPPNSQRISGQFPAVSAPGAAPAPLAPTSPEPAPAPAPTSPAPAAPAPPGILRPVPPVSHPISRPPGSESPRPPTPPPIPTASSMRATRPAAPPPVPPRRRDPGAASDEDFAAEESPVHPAQPTPGTRLAPPKLSHSFETRPGFGPSRSPSNPHLRLPTDQASPASPEPPPEPPTLPRIAPSQAARPNPIAPGSSVARPPVPVESMDGPFPREPASRPGAPPPRPKSSPRSAPEPRPPPPPGMTDADVSALYAKYVKAKEMVGEAADPGTYGKLLQTINAQAPKIMEQYKAKGVDFSVVVKDNQVIIRAKPKP